MKKKLLIILTLLSLATTSLGRPTLSTIRDDVVTGNEQMDLMGWVYYGNINRSEAEMNKILLQEIKAYKWVKTNNFNDFEAKVLKASLQESNPDTGGWVSLVKTYKINLKERIIKNKRRVALDKVWNEELKLKNERISSNSLYIYPFSL